MDFLNNCLILWVIRDIWRGIAFEYSATRTLNITIVFNFGEFAFSLNKKYIRCITFAMRMTLLNFMPCNTTQLSICMPLFVARHCLHFCCCSLKRLQKKEVNIKWAKFDLFDFPHNKKFVANFFYINLTNDNLCIIVSSFSQKNNIWNLKN